MTLIWSWLPILSIGLFFLIWYRLAQWIAPMDKESSKDSETGHQVRKLFTFSYLMTCLRVFWALFFNFFVCLNVLVLIGDNHPFELRYMQLFLFFVILKTTVLWLFQITNRSQTLFINNIILINAVTKLFPHVKPKEIVHESGSWNGKKHLYWYKRDVV